MKVLADTTRGFIFAVLAGPLAIIPAMMALIVAMLAAGVFEADDVAKDLGYSLMVAIFGAMYGYGFVVLYGAPIYAVLRRYKKATLLNIVIASLGPSSIALIALPSAWPLWAAMAYFSITVAITCWYIVIATCGPALTSDCVDLSTNHTS